MNCSYSTKSTKKFTDHSCFDNYSTMSVSTTGSKKKKSKSNQSVQNLQVIPLNQQNSNQQAQTYSQNIPSNQFFPINNYSYKPSNVDNMKEYYESQMITLNNELRSTIQKYGSLQNENLQLKQEIQQNSSKKVLEASIDIENQYKHQLESKERIINDLKTTLSDKDKQLENTKSQFELMKEKQKQMLENTLLSSSNNLKTDHEKEVSKLQKQFKEELEKQTNMFNKEREGYIAKCNLSVKEEIEKTKGEVKQLSYSSNKTISIQSEKIKALEAELKTTTEKFYEFKTNYQEIKEKMDTLEQINKDEITELTTKSNTLITEYRNKIETLQKTCNEQTRKIKELEDNKTKLENEVKVQEEKYKIHTSRIENNVRRINGSFQDYIKKAEEREKEIDKTYNLKLKDQDRIISSLKQDTTELINLRESYKTQSERMADTKVQFGEVNDKCRKLEAKMKKEMEMNATSKDKYDMVVAEYEKMKINFNSVQKQNESYKLENKNLFTENATLKSELDMAVNSCNSIQKQNSRANKLLENALAKEKGLTSHLQKEVVVLKDRCAQFQKYKETLEFQSIELNTITEKNKQLNSKVLEISNKLTDIKAEHSKSRDELEELLQKEKINKNTIQSLEFKLQHQYTQVELLEKTKKDYSLEMQSLRENISNITYEREELFKNNAKMKDKITELSVNIERINKNNEEITKQSRELKKKNDDITASFTLSKKELEEEKRKYDEILSLYNNYVKQLNVIKKNHEVASINYKNNLTSLTNDKKELQEQLKSLNSKLDDFRKLKAQYDEAQEELNKQKVELYQKEEIISRTNSASENIKSILNEERNAFNIKTQKYDDIINEKEKTIEKLRQMEPKIKEIYKDLCFYKNEYGNIEKYKNQYEETYSLLKTTKTQLDILTKNHETIQSNYNVLLQENVKYKNEIKDIHELEKKITDKTKEYFQLEQLKTKLEKRVSYDEAITKDIKEQLMIKIHEANTHFSTIQKLTNEMNEKEITYKKRIEQQSNQLHNVQKDLFYANGKLSTIEENEERMKEYKKNFEEVKNENNKLNQIITEYKRQIDEKTKELEISYNKILNITNTMNEFKSSNSIYSSNHKKLKEATDIIIKRHEKTIEHLNAQLQMTTKEKDNNTIRLSTLRLVETERDTLNKSLEELSEKYNQLKKSNTMNLKQIKTISDKYTQVKLDYDAYKQLKAESNIILEANRELQKTIELQKQEINHLKDNSNDLLMEKSKGMQIELYHLKQDYEVQFQEYKRFKTDNNMLKEKNRKLEEDNENFGKELRKLSIMNQELEKTIKELPTPKEYRRVLDSREVLSFEVNNNKKKMDDLEDKLIKLPGLLKQMEKQKNTIDKLTSDIISLKSDLNKYDKMDIEQKELLYQKNRQIEKQTDFLEENRNEIERLRIQVEDLSLKPARFEAKLKKLRDENLITLHKYIQDKKDLEEKVKELNIEITFLRSGRERVESVESVG